MFDFNKADLANIKECLKVDGYCILKNIIPHEIIENARVEYFQSIHQNYLHAQAESFLPEDILENPWRKTAVGSGNGVGEKYSQVLQTTYLPINNQKNFQNLSHCIKISVILRNKLTNMNKDFGFGFNFHQGTYWNASRVHHYPCGGGHMSEHADTHFPSILSESNIPFVQVAVLLSSRKDDFDDGGGFIINRSNEKIFFEDEHSKGSIVIFDGSLKHGVEDIDPSKVIDWNSNKGRIALFSNLYVAK